MSDGGVTLEWDDDAEERLRALARKKMLAIVQLYERILQGLFRTTKHGRRYRRGNKSHTASAKGEPPAIDSGRLTRSVVHEITEESNGVVRGTVGSTIRDPNYPQILEYVKDRPAWIPAIQMTQARLNEVLNEERDG